MAGGTLATVTIVAMAAEAMATATTAVTAAGTLVTATTAATAAGTLAAATTAVTAAEAMVTATTVAMAAGTLVIVMTVAMAGGMTAMTADSDAVAVSPVHPAIPTAMTAVARNPMAWTSSARLVPAVRRKRANPSSGWRKTEKRTTTSNNRKSMIRKGLPKGLLFSKILLTHGMGKDISN